MQQPHHDEDRTVKEIQDAALEKHIPFIEDAGQEGVQILCLQEIFNGPYFCPSQDGRWYDAAEPIPGPTTEALTPYAQKYEMVLIIPLYERAQAGVYYNSAAIIDADGKYLGTYRKNHLPHTSGFWEKYFFKPGNLGYPVFDTAYAKVGLYICGSPVVSGDLICVGGHGLWTLPRLWKTPETPGSFLLTGSANVLLVPRISESLAGRMEVTKLMPFSQGEIDRRNEGFIEAVFADDVSSVNVPAETRDELVGRILRGGYPEVVAREDAGRRAAWFGSYLNTILQRDVRDMAQIEGLTMLPRLLTLLSARASGLLNTADIARLADIPNTTLRRYLALFEMTFLIPLNPGLVREPPHSSREIAQTHDYG